MSQLMIGLGFTLSIFLAVLTVGMAATREDLRCVLGRPARLARALLAINVLVPLVAVIVCKSFSLHPAVMVGLVTLSVAPVRALFAQSMLPMVAPGRDACVNGHSYPSQQPGGQQRRPDDADVRPGTTGARPRQGHGRGALAIPG